MTHVRHIARATLPAYQPDDNALAACDKHVRLAVLSAVAAGLSDVAAATRVLAGVGGLVDLIEVDDPPTFDAAAWELARHGARYGMAAQDVAALLASLVRRLPNWPDDRQHLAAIVRAAFREVSE